MSRSHGVTVERGRAEGLERIGRAHVGHAPHRSTLRRSDLKRRVGARHMTPRQGGKRLLRRDDACRGGQQFDARRPRGRSAGRERGRKGGMESHLAYLDAGSGSLIVQALVAGTAGMVVAVKLYWRRLKGVFRRKTGRGERKGAGTGRSARRPTGTERSVTPEHARLRTPSRVLSATPRPACSTPTARCCAGWVRRRRRTGRPCGPATSSPATQADGTVTARPTRSTGSCPASGTWRAALGPRADPVRVLSRTSGRTRCARRRPPPPATCSSDALAAGFTMKDGSAYNLQWRGAAAGVHRHRLVRAGASRASRGPATGSSARRCSTR